jgi:hypothetical protein
MFPLLKEAIPAINSGYNNAKAKIHEVTAPEDE